MHPQIHRSLLVAFSLSVSAAAAGAESPAGAADFARDVAPIFRVYCAGCHSGGDPEGGLSLVTYALLRKGGDGGDPIVPGNPDDSLLLRLVEGRERPAMPPRRKPAPPESARAMLRRWIAEGARGPDVDRSILETAGAPSIEAREGVRQPITALAISPGGGRLAVARFRRVELRDAATYSLEREIGGFPGKVHGVQFTRDGRGLVIANGVAGLSGEARIVLLDGIDGAPPARVFGGHRDVLYDAVLSPDETRLATAGYDRVIKIWDARDGRLLREIDVHKGAVFDLEFDPSGSVLASASADETVKLWRIADGVRLDTLNQPQGEQFATAFTPDGRHVLSAGADRRLHLWRFASRNEPALNPVEESRFAHEGSIVSLRVLRGGTRAVTAAADGTLKVWSVPELDELASYETQPDVVAAIVEVTGEEAFVVARLDGSLERYRLPAPCDERSGGEAAASEEASARGGAASATGAGEPQPHTESEPNELARDAETVTLPVEVRGEIGAPGDADLFRFAARSGDELTLEVDAARSGSRLDSRIEVLDPQGRSLEQVTLQAVRDSWFTFRGKDSSTSDDFRLHNWREMELDEYLWANGEVVRLWLYPRGPDSGFKVYPGFGARHTSFATSALAHPLGAPAYIVKPLARGEEPVPNGLPVFRVYCENDDDPTRERGIDSLFCFTVPHDGEYVARVSDVRGFGGEGSFPYRLSIRERRPRFEVSLGGTSPAVSPGSGRELSFTATRIEGFEGPIRIDIEGVPKGFAVTAPIVIEENQRRAFGVIRTAPDASSPSAEESQAVRVTASAVIEGRRVVRELGDLGAITAGGPAKLTVAIDSKKSEVKAARDESGRLVFTIRPGETIEARVRATRHDFEGRIELGGDDSGRNLPHGLYVDHIGLNGLLIVEGETEREFSITAAPIAKPCERPFHLRATADGGQCSEPAVIRVLPAR